MKVDITMTLAVDEKENILPIAEEMYEEVVSELIQDVIYDIDGAEIQQIKVKQK